MTVPESILSRIFVTEYGCHLWLGALTEKGYGRVTREQKGKKVHRLIWEMTGRDLPDYVPGGKQLDHLCLEKSCCNPAHLEVVTQLTNMQRRAANRTHCKNGHKLTSENTVIQHGYKVCQECRKAWALEATARNRPAGWIHPKDRVYCDHGHLWETQAAYNAKGYRFCRACMARSRAKWRKKGKVNG